MNFFSYTYKQLNLLTILGNVLLLVLIYRFNVRPTIELRKECIDMQNQIATIDNASLRLQELKIEFKKLNHVSGNSNLSNDAIRQSILNFTNQHIKNARINSFKEAHSYTANNTIVHTNFLELQGNYSDLILIAWDFEKKFKTARLTAIKLYSTEDSRTKKTTLYGIYYFQNFKKIN